MAIQTKAKWARLKVGVFAIVSMSILAILVFLITGQTNFFESKVVVYTYLSDAAALTIGAPVNLDGIPIGKVKQIEQQRIADLVLVDAPATGHTMTFLSSAQGLLDAARAGPVRVQATDVVELLSDPERCQVALVAVFCPAMRSPEYFLIRRRWRHALSEIPLMANLCNYVRGSGIFLRVCR